MREKLEVADQHGDMRSRINNHVAAGETFQVEQLLNEIGGEISDDEKVALLAEAYACQAKYIQEVAQSWQSLAPDDPLRSHFAKLAEEDAARAEAAWAMAKMYGALVGAAQAMRPSGSDAGMLASHPQKRS